jgi:PPOX class probable F420-dependent enzyme
MAATLSAVVSTQLPDIAKKLLDQQVFVTVSTLNPDGSPQASVLWATYDDDDILLSTVIGRAKERNWRRDPRVSVLFFDPATPYNYVEVRGRVELTTEGGPELIQRLSQLYVGEPYTADEGTDNVRVVARVKADKVITR